MSGVLTILASFRPLNMLLAKFVLIVPPCRNDEQCRKSLLGLSFRQARGQMGLLRSIMHELGGNDYKQAHNDGRKRRRETGTSVDLSINLDDYDRCVAYLSAYVDLE